MDNHLALPPHVATFAFQPARHYGVDIVKNRMVGAKTTSRWYIVVAMGRKAGHLALGIGKAAGVPLTLIPEEFPSHQITLKEICDIVEGSIIKRRSQQRDHGVAILAEGLLEFMSEQHLEEV